MGTRVDIGMDDIGGTGWVTAAGGVVDDLVEVGLTDSGEAFVVGDGRDAIAFAC